MYTLIYRSELRSCLLEQSLTRSLDQDLFYEHAQSANTFKCHGKSLKYKSNVLLSLLGSNEVCCCSVISAVACEFLCLSLCTPENVSEFEMHNKSMMHTYVCVCECMYRIVCRGQRSKEQMID